MRAQQAPVVVICDDVGAAPSPLRLGELTMRLRRELSGAVVVGVPALCRAPKALADVLTALHPERLVLGCRGASQRRDELLMALRRSGVAAAGCDVVDLLAADCSDEEVVLEQSVTLLRAAVARVADADLEAPVRERTSLSVGALSRRSLFSGISAARHLIAVWRPERCAGGAACSACVLACPHGALRREGGRLVVDGDRCTGCGVCAVACRSGAFALPGASFDGLGAAAGVLVESIRRGTPACGVAIACQASRTAPEVGEPWLVLRVPSLEIVTAGWLLQLAGAAVGARVVACRDKDCERRAGELEGFVHAVAEVLGFSLEGSAGAGERPSMGPAKPAPSLSARLEFQEPEATTQALAALGAFEPGRPHWRAAGRGCSLGVVSIDPAGCSLCGVCVGACPTGALAAERDGAGSLRLSLDSRRCSSCGACVDICPERVMTLHRGLDSTLLAAGRRVMATESTAVCETCRAPLDTALSPAVLARMAGPYPFLATGAEKICADCRLKGRSVKVGQRA